MFSLADLLIVLTSMAKAFVIVAGTFTVFAMGSRVMAMLVRSFPGSTHRDRR